MKQAFKKKYDYASDEKYRIFLKKKFTTLTPRYYSVVAAEEVDTCEGPMVAMKIVTDEIENPNYEPIAEVWINDEYVYLWREHCWTIAVNKNNERIYQMQDRWHDLMTKGRQVFSAQTIINPDKFTIAPSPCNKVILIHKIGHEPVE